MFHDGMTPGGFRVARHHNRSQELCPPKPNTPGALAGEEAVAGAMLDACGLGDMPSGQPRRTEQPAAHYRCFQDLPGPFISPN